MRTLFLLSLTLFFFSNLQAQSAKKIPGRLAAQREVISYLLNKNPQQATKVAMKTTSTIKERVIGQSTFDNTLDTIPTLTDSFNTRYTSIHGSVYDYNMMFYAYNYPYDNSPMFDFGGVFTKPQVQYDTLMHWTADPDSLGVFGIYEINYAVYDTAINLTGYTDLFRDSSLNQNMAYSNVFDTSKNITTGYWFNLNLGIADTSDKQYFSYNSAHKLIADSIYQISGGIWMLKAKSYYTYDTAGNLSRVDYYVNFGDSMVEQLQYINTYDASARLATVLTSYFDGDSLAPYITDTFDYTTPFTSGLNYYTSWKEYEFDGINHVWVGNTYTTRHINATGKPDTIYTNNWNGETYTWVPLTKGIVTYNSFTDPVSLTNYTYSDTGYASKPTDTTTYYYETYLIPDPPPPPPPTSVQNVAANNARFVIYPNPANNEINITQANVPAGIQTTANIFSSNGQLVKAVLLNTNASTAIGISELSPGVYWLNVYGNNGNIFYKQAFVKE